jgi:hypothetical protein
MSHFSVIVCLDDPSKLEAVLAPFDENLEVEEYRAYEEGEASDFWLYRSLKRTAEDFAKGKGILPYKPDEIGWSSSSSKDAPEVQRQKQADEARLFHSLPNPIGWRDIVRFHNERYDDDSERMHYDAATDRAYTLSTRSQNGKWDYWRIGGRWGGYFTTTSPGDLRLFKPERAWDSPDVLAKDSCDGGPKGLLDLDGMRERAAAKARETHEKWLNLVEGTPEARPWREFAEMIGKIDGYTREQARLEYRTQPRMVALEGSEFGEMWDCPVATHQKPDRVFVELARAQAVPGFALVTVERKWMAPGEMGWFGASTDSESSRVGYLEVANAYIESLPDSAYLIAVDCHV